MTTNAAWIQVDPQRMRAFRDEAIARLKRAAAEWCWTSPPRSASIRTEFARWRIWPAWPIEIGQPVLRAVNMDVYRVLKLLKLAQRFTILT